MMGFQLAFILLQALVVSRSHGSLEPSDINVQCDEQGFSISINKARLSGDNEQLAHFSFIDRSCLSTSNDSHLVGHTAYTQCGTIKRKTGSSSMVEYTNELLNPFYIASSNSETTLDGDLSVDARCPHLKLKITCLVEHPMGLHVSKKKIRRRRNTVFEGRAEKIEGCPQNYAFDSPKVSSNNEEETTIKKSDFVTCPFLVGIGETLEPDHVFMNTRVRTPIRMKQDADTASLCKPLKRRGGNIRLVMSLHNDRSFTDIFDHQAQQRTSSLTFSNVFYKIQHLSGHDNFKMVPVTCYATPDSNPKNPTSYFYIKNGCPVDPTVKFYHKSPDSSDGDGASKFSITSFQFKNSDSHAFYSHCDVMVCDKKDQSEQCNRPCQQQGQWSVVTSSTRRKRSMTSLTNNVGGKKIIRDNRRASSIKIISLGNGKFQLVRFFKKPCVRLLHIESFENTKVVFTIFVPRDAKILDQPIPFKVTQLKKYGNTDELAYKLNPGKGSNFIIKKCNFGKRGDLILENGRTSRNTKYEGLITVHPDNVITINTKHLSFNLKKHNKLACKIVLCDEGQDCSKACPRFDEGRKSFINRRTRKSITQEYDERKNIEVDCLADRMIIRIKKSSSNTFYLGDPSCNAKYDGTFVTLTTAYDGCGTTFSQSNGKYVYTNQVTEKVPDTLKIIRGPLLKQQVNCALKKSISSSAVIRLKRKRLRASGVGSYKVEIDMYKDSTFTEKNNNSIIEIDEKQDMFFGVQVKSKAFRDTLELHLDTCLGYNQPKEGEERKTHIFIKDGCPRDKSVQFYNNHPDTSQVRFSVKPFKFDGDDSMMVNCFVTACSVNDQNSKCKQMKDLKKVCSEKV